MPQFREGEDGPAAEGGAERRRRDSREHRGLDTQVLEGPHNVTGLGLVVALVVLDVVRVLEERD